MTTNISSSLTLIENDGDEALYRDLGNSDAYVFTNADGELIQITTGGATVNPSSFANTQARHIAANGDGTYTLLWEVGDGERIDLWTLNSNGAYIGGRNGLSDEEIAAFEGQFQSDLNGDGSLLALIENDGDEALYRDLGNSDAYVFTNADGELFQITTGGATVNPSSFANTQARHIAANGDGTYTLLWEVGDGERIDLWTLNSNGAYIGGRNGLSDEEIAAFEGQFQSDLNGDGSLLALIENDGDEALYRDLGNSDAYVFTNADGELIQITTGGATVNPSSFANTQARHIAANGDGTYTLLWEVGDGERIDLWTLNSNGAYIGGRNGLSDEEIAAFEGQFQSDLNGDGSLLALIENDGDEALYRDLGNSDAFVFTNADGELFQITTGGATVNPSSFANTQARHIAANGDGTYTLLWEVGDGERIDLWTLNSNGAYIGGRNGLSDEEIAAFEGQFQSDLNGDGSLLALIENDGDEALYRDLGNSDAYVFTNADGELFQITTGGATVNPSSFANTQARHIAANGDGTYTLLWEVGDGERIDLWTLNSNGAYIGGRNGLSDEEIAAFEGQFQSDLNGDGSLLALIENDGDEALYRDLGNSDAYVFTNADGELIQITTGGATVNPSSFANTQARHIAANGDGTYTLLWEVGDGERIDLWTLNSNGAYIGGRNGLSDEEIAAFEGQFQSDLNGDGSLLALIENDGDEALYRDLGNSDAFVFTNADGELFQITTGGATVNPSSFANTQARHIAANGDGTYTLLWEVGDGERIDLWTLNSNGAYIGGRNGLSDEEIAAFEGQFQSDLNGDGLF
ncbi:hypothetical protein [Phaeobacter inhibens]|uniref:hypothetical protein n=1 Tax=Phaeobacter inhibens TaxID=221822 RepID=UPI000C9C2B2C|nr:hypothetical protein [Phaeobacter inhibens]AUQ52886.1 acetyltransferase domain containing protein [Phaeobacter inhibens]AUQ76903.1 acetyltransferase domain containing protein [Phaeobacter inhibens]AUR14062.1 acetyltransferase domain containing protein [Phaeobacter inhibens]